MITASAIGSPTLRKRTCPPRAVILDATPRSRAHAALLGARGCLLIDEAVDLVERDRVRTAWASCANEANRGSSSHVDLAGRGHAGRQRGLGMTALDSSRRRSSATDKGLERWGVATTCLGPLIAQLRVVGLARCARTARAGSLQRITLVLDAVCGRALRACGQP